MKIVSTCDQKFHTWICDDPWPPGTQIHGDDAAGILRDEKVSPKENNLQDVRTVSVCKVRGASYILIVRRRSAEDDRRCTERYQLESRGQE